MKFGKKISVFLVLATVVILGSCRSADGKVIKDYDVLRDAINSKKFEIEHQWALPMGGGMIDLIGNPNFIRVNKDSVDLFLPYFGVRHSGGGYNRNDGGLIFKGPVRNLSISEDNNRRFQIKFEGKQNQDLLRFIINIYPDGNANTSVMMSQRQTISYRGSVRELPSEKN